MPSCLTCNARLPGSSWKVDDLDQNGGRLGINGYFLSEESPNLMYCYCRSCWEKAVFDVSFVKRKIDSLKSRIDSLKNKLNSSEEQLVESQKSETELKQQLTNVQTENHILQQELNKFNTDDVQNLKNLVKQLDNEQTIILQSVGDFNINEFECKHIAHQHTVAKISVKEAMEKLKVGVKKVIEHQIDQLPIRQQGLEKCIEAMNSAGMPKEVMEKNIALLRKHIDEETGNSEKWKKFQADLEEGKEEDHVSQITDRCDMNA